ncbi:MAG: gluconolaconase [Planctomycetaceae bacterium]|nr:gluconolaconase [Planctomycetaceae bacterium]
MNTVLMVAVLLGADPTPQQKELLEIFRKEFIAITPGTGKFPASFQMGQAGEGASSQPLHQVTFNYHFHVARYEVPQNLWEAVMGSNPSRWKGPRNSVELLTFDDAMTFCAKATTAMRKAKLIGEKQVIRLPSEAEWEYVARAGTKTVYSFGDDVKKLDDFGWHTGNAAGNDPPVGAKKPNRWGLYDVHGYLWEWCLDHGHETYEGAPQDGSAWTQAGDSQKRIMRGGSWKDKPAQLASANRDGALRTSQGVIRFRGGIRKDLRDDAVGLRCILAEIK